MTATYASSRPNRGPAFLAAAMLHLAVFAALALLATRPAITANGSAVPVTLVSNAPVTDTRAADQDAQTQLASVETPAPRQPPPTPAPAPAIAPAPTPAKAAKAAPTAARDHAATPAAARRAFDLDALQANIAKAARMTPTRQAMARPGPRRAETAPAARVDAGQGVSQSNLQGLQQLLERLWNPDCDVSGGAAVTVPVTFTVGEDGRLSGRVRASGEQTSADPVVAAAARRAIDAVHQAEPYGPEYRGSSFKVIFDARKACA